MITDKIKNIFDFIPETNLIEEFFYEHKGVFPVFSGQTENNGIVAFVDSFSQDGECVSFTTYGVGAGKLFYRNNRYTIGRNCMGLKVKEKYKNKINLKWFSYNFQNFFYRHRIGDSTGQRSVNKILIQNLEIKIPDKQIQDQQLGSYEKAFEYSQKIENKLDSCRAFQMASVQITDFKFEERIRSVFNIVGGNSGLTEEFIYYNLPTTEEEKIPIFSGATQKTNTLGFISRNAILGGRKLKVFNLPAILIVRKGFAGNMKYINNIEFTTNDDAYVLTVKKEWKDKINLRWFAYRYKELFYNLVTSKSDNATFNKEYAERQKIKIPDISVQNEIAEKLEKIDILVSKLEQAKTKVDELLEYEVM